MKAVIWTQYGPPEVLQVQEIPTPTPKEHEVRIRVHAATVTAGDWEARSLKFPFWLNIMMRGFVGVLKPTRVKILGQELAGVVDAVGKDVTRFKVGDAVFGSTGFSFGAYAEYNCLPADSEDSALAIKPDNISFAEAAALPTGALEALHFLRLGKIQPGEKLLVIGGGGSIGTAGVQLAKHYGAEVTALDHGSKLDFLRDLGADHVVDYTKEDFAQRGETYDLIFDVVGKNTFQRSMRVLNPGGRYLLANPRISSLIQGLWLARDGKKVIAKTAERHNADLVHLAELIADGTLKVIMDEHRFTLDQMAEAHRYAESGLKKGNIIIDVVEEGQ